MCSAVLNPGEVAAARSGWARAAPCPQRLFAEAPWAVNHRDPACTHDGRVLMPVPVPAPVRVQPASHGPTRMKTASWAAHHDAVATLWRTCTRARTHLDTVRGRPATAHEDGGELRARCLRSLRGYAACVDAGPHAAAPPPFSTAFDGAHGHGQPSSFGRGGTTGLWNRGALRHYLQQSQPRQPCGDYSYARAHTR